MREYAGNFNLNMWLRIFVRDDIVDNYELQCLEIVARYEGSNAKNTFPYMIAELNACLADMSNRIMKEVKAMEPVEHGTYEITKLLAEAKENK